MARTIRYLTHPQVLVDPATDVQNWSLSDLGRRRVAELASSGGLEGTARVISSAETKALETAKPLVDALQCSFEVRKNMHENDRSATGFLPPDEFEGVADQFFANPENSIRGWETAQAAQDRIVAEVDACLRRDGDGDVLFVGHGAVGTLLFCHLGGLAISRAYDQIAGGGCYIEFTTGAERSVSRWSAMEALGKAPVRN